MKFRTFVLRDIVIVALYGFFILLGTVFDYPTTLTILVKLLYFVYVASRAIFYINYAIRNKSK